jgi:hypothetical protein
LNGTNCVNFCANDESFTTYQWYDCSQALSSQHLQASDHSIALSMMTEAAAFPDLPPIVAMRVPGPLSCLAGAGKTFSMDGCIGSGKSTDCE